MRLGKLGQGPAVAIGWASVIIKARIYGKKKASRQKTLARCASASLLRFPLSNIDDVLPCEAFDGSGSTSALFTTTFRLASLIGADASARDRLHKSQGRRKRTPGAVLLALICWSRLSLSSRDVDPRLPLEHWLMSERASALSSKTSLSWPSGAWK